jgi:hypothetical protein
LPTNWIGKSKFRLNVSVKSIGDHWSQASRQLGIKGIVIRCLESNVFVACRFGECLWKSCSKFAASSLENFISIPRSIFSRAVDIKKIFQRLYCTRLALQEQRMADQPFITLVAGGMQARSETSIATHDTSRAQYHMSELGTFAARLENVRHLPV